MGRCIQSDTVSLRPSRSRLPDYHTMASSSMLVLLVSACLMAQSMAYFYGGLGGGYYGYGLGGGFGLGYGGYGGMWGMPYGGYGLGLGMGYGYDSDSDSEWALPQLSESACPSWVVLAKWPTKSSSHPSTGLTRTSSCSGLTAAHDI